MQQLLRRHLTQRCGPRISGGVSHLAGFADWMRAHGHFLSSHKRHQAAHMATNPKAIPVAVMYARIVRSPPRLGSE
jgi:hypothetical protein